MTGLRIAIGIALGALLLGAAELGVRAAGIEAGEWSAAQPGIRVDPLLGPLLRPGWSGTWFGGFRVTVDERGFRATGHPPAARPARRIAFLGDSSTFGWAVDSPDTFVALLDARQHDGGGVAQVDFVNAAFPGQSAVVGQYVLRERVLPLDPDVVVLGFGANNAFRLSLAGDAARFRFVSAYKLLLRSRLYRLLGAWTASLLPPRVHPRDRGAVTRTPLAKLERVAFLDEFDAAMRAMVADARGSGARVVLLILPRAAEVSAEHAYEDAATTSTLELRPPGAPPTPVELGLLEVSCLDHRRVPDAVQALHAERPAWQRVYPERPEVRAVLEQGAEAYVREQYAAAAARFAAAVEIAPRSPLARYDLGAAKLAAGDATGLRDLEEADRLACNVFLQYQVALWRIAAELGVPAVDITLFFQAHDGEPLFLDPAHPNRDGHRIIADALWPAIAAPPEGAGRRAAEGAGRTRPLTPRASASRGPGSPAADAPRAAPSAR